MQSITDRQPRPEWKRIGTCSESPDETISSEEVQDMFDEAQDIGRGPEFADNLRKRSER